MVLTGCKKSPVLICSLGPEGMFVISLPQPVDMRLVQNLDCDMGQMYWTPHPDCYPKRWKEGGH